MENLQFPICSIIISVIICIIFFSKKRISNHETLLFGENIIVQLIGSIIETTIYVLAYIYYDKQIIIFLNNFVCLSYIIWISNLFIYIYLISKNECNDKLFKKINKILSIFLLVTTIVIFISPINLVNENGLMYSYGLKSNITFALCGIFLLLSIIVQLINIKKIDRKKSIPLYIFLLFGIVTLIVRVIQPSWLVISLILSLINLIMYFTIENPDVKMLKQMEMAKIDAERANNAKSDFLSSMSHEIRTPLNAIVGLSEDIDSFKDQVPAQVVEDTEDIRSASQTLLEIVGNILDINKIESQKMEIINETYNPRETIEKLAKINATRIGDKQIDFKINIAEDLPYKLSGDRQHLKQILNNLLSNAFKYTEKGEVNLTVKCINSNDMCNLMITVQDTGRGIKKENISKLFTKFERLDVEKNSTTEGTGLGLAITKSLVDMLGGKINVESNYGEGTMFIVQLPQKIIEQTNSLTNTQVIKLNEIRKEEIKNTNYGRKRVLIVDDNKLNIKVARRALDSFNLVLDECYDGQECLDKVVNGDEYDLILMDIMMPNMSGETALEKLKENPNFNIPTLALTADAVAGAKEKYLEEGFVDYIAKPFSKEQIKEKLDIVFDNPSITSIFNEDRLKDAPMIIMSNGEVIKKNFDE